LNYITNYKLFNIAEKAADSAAITALDFIQNSGIISNSGKDIKTLADEKMNEVIFSYLTPTEIPIISEESNNIEFKIADKCWIIDPLDGTFNFTRGYPFFSVSIALWVDNKPKIAVIKDISNSVTYCANEGAGATLNGIFIKVSNTLNVNNGILTTGFPSGGDYSSETLMNFVSNVQKFKKVRAVGSASLMLCHVAQGICDVYYENDIYLWDIAAGVLLVQEAGGKIYMKRKGNSLKYEVLASNKLIFDEACKLLVK
jgi:fructose-1,6-bisphosphatase/inositol monophosphatase family enzyme